jgi:outer membrane immunogenic protein
MLPGTLPGAAALGAVAVGAAAFGAALWIGLPAPAKAADLTANYYATPVPYYAFSWAGPYIGGTAGYEWGSVDNSATRPSGFAGGVEAGCALAPH